MFHSLASCCEKVEISCSPVESTTATYNSILLFSFTFWRRLSSLAFAGTKTYNIILDSPTKAGDTELKAGEYKLKVEGSEAVFTQNDKTWKAPVKIQNNSKKFDQTGVVDVYCNIHPEMAATIKSSMTRALA